MREAGRSMTEDFGIGLAQMTENAGPNLDEPLGAGSGHERDAGLRRAGGGRDDPALRVRGLPRRGLRRDHRNGGLGEGAGDALACRDHLGGG
jgi:hypothetical protein